MDMPAYSNADFGWLTDDPFDTNINYARKEFRFQSMSLVIPAVVRANFKPGLIVLAPYCGIYYTAPVFKDWAGNMETEGPPLGVIAGFSVGRKLGPGILTLDLNYGLDMGNTRVTRKDSNYEGEVKYWRHRLSITAGYDFGFLDRGIKAGK
jgi:hypothetical protein